MIERDKPLHCIGHSGGGDRPFLTLVGGMITSIMLISERSVMPLRPGPTLTLEQLFLVSWGERMAIEEPSILVQRKR